MPRIFRVYSRSFYSVEVCIVFRFDYLGGFLVEMLFRSSMRKIFRLITMFIIRNWKESYMFNVNTSDNVQKH